VYVAPDWATTDAVWLLLFGITALYPLIAVAAGGETTVNTPALEVVDAVVPSRESVITQS
jgi:hypothetical protein